MTLTLLAVGLCGAVAGLGIWMAATRTALQLTTGGSRRLDPTLLRAVTAALVLGVAAGLAVGVPVLAVLVAGLTWVTVEALHGPSVPALTSVGEAVASWAETIRQELEAGQPLRAAVVAACDTPPPPLEIPLRRLAGALEHRPLPQALWGLRADVDHAALGPIVAALDVAYHRGAGDLPRLMASQVDATRHRVAVLQDLHAARAKHRRAMVLLLALFGVSVVVLLAIWPTFLAAYRPPVGEMVLAGISLAVITAVRSLVRMSQPDLPPDFFPGPTPVVTVDGGIR